MAIDLRTQITAVSKEVLVVVALLSFLNTSVANAKPLDELIARMSFQGVQINMPIEDAKRTLKGRGFKLADSDTNVIGCDWEKYFQRMGKDEASGVAVLFASSADGHVLNISMYTSIPIGDNSTVDKVVNFMGAPVCVNTIEMFGMRTLSWATGVNSCSDGGEFKGDGPVFSIENINHPKDPKYKLQTLHISNDVSETCTRKRR